MLGRMRRKSARRGFTLVEAIVSIAVFAIAAVMFAMILFTATNMVNMSLLNEGDLTYVEGEYVEYVTEGGRRYVIFLAAEDKGESESGGGA